MKLHLKFCFQLYDLLLNLYRAVELESIKWRVTDGKRAEYFLRFSAGWDSFRFPSLSGGIADRLPGVDGVWAGEGDHCPSLLAGSVPVRATSGRRCRRVRGAFCQTERNKRRGKTWDTYSQSTLTSLRAPGWAGRYSSTATVIRCEDTFPGWRSFGRHSWIFHLTITNIKKQHTQ